MDATGTRRADVLIGADGFIAAVEENIDSSVGVLDAAGAVVSPGFVDLHCHIRHPGHEAAETIESGSRAAALGGFTAVVLMPDLEPAVDSVAMIREIQSLSSSALCDILPAAAITVGRKGTQLAPIGELAAVGVRLFTDADRSVQDSQMLLNALQYSAQFEATIMECCDDLSLSNQGQMNEGYWSSQLGLQGVPSEAEEIVLSRDVALLRLASTRVSAKLHLTGITTRRSVAQIRTAKAERLDVSADTQPQYFTFADSNLQSYDPVFKVFPPLRTEIDMEALRVGLSDGAIDAISTGHDPQRREEKEQAFSEAAPGMIGLETALAAAMTELHVPLDMILSLMSWEPARIAGLRFLHGEAIVPDSPANLCVIDPVETWTVPAESRGSRSANSPFVGRSLRGRVRHTLLWGEPVVIEGKAQR